jgi:hypothetical protein
MRHRAPLNNFLFPLPWWCMVFCGACLMYSHQPGRQAASERPSTLHQYLSLAAPYIITTHDLFIIHTERVSERENGGGGGGAHLVRSLVRSCRPRAFYGASVEFYIITIKVDMTHSNRAHFWPAARTLIINSPRPAIKQGEASMSTYTFDAYCLRTACKLFKITAAYSNYCAW